MHPRHPRRELPRSARPPRRRPRARRRPARGPPRARSPPAGWGRRGSSGRAAPPADHHPKTRAAFASTVASSSAYGVPRSSASASAVATTFAGSFAPPADRLRRQERGVGLDQQQLVRDLAGGRPQGLGLRVGEVAGERAVPAPLGRLGGALGRRGEAVQDHRHPDRLGAQDLERVRERLAVGRRPAVADVDHERLRDPAGDPDVGLEGVPLVVAGSVVAVEVEPRLADRGDPRVRAPAPRSAPPRRRRSRSTRSGGGRPRRTPPRAPRPPRSPPRSRPRRCRR